MAQGSFSLGKAFGDGWEGFKANAGAAIGGLVVWMVIGIIGGMVPFVNFVYNLLLAGPMTGGLVLLLLNLHRRKAAVGDVFGGFKKFGSFLGLYWLYFLIAVLAALPALLVGAIGYFLTSGNAQDEAMVNVGIAAGVIAMIGVTYVSLRYYFVYFIVADDWEDGSIVNAFRKSARLTEGNRLKLLGSGILLGIIGMLGAIALLVGLLVTIPLVGAAMASIYEQLKESAADETSGQTL